MAMNRIRTLCAVLAMLAATAAAVKAVEHLSDWLVDTAGNEGRAALALANAPWFVGDQAVPAALPAQSPSRRAP
jgi:hypothetical protein